MRGIVLELVEGETLAERIARGPIPLDDALPIARQIAEALEAAHEKSIVHRDLKPANITITPAGVVKVLDFGLAKAAGGSGGHRESGSPKLTATRHGVIMGTAAYMSPEQARGQAVDKRAGIWAFGCVLFEMLTGRWAFGDEDVSMTLSNVLQRDPDFEAFPANVHPRVRQAIRVCLGKPLRERVGDIHAVRLALDGAFETATLQTTATTNASRRGRYAWIASFAAAVVGMVALGVPALRHWREPPPSAPAPVRFSMDLAPADRLGRTTSYARPSRTAFAIAPDGATVVFVGEVQLPTRSTMLYRRPLAESHAVAIPGTEGAEYPFFSPDSQWVGFGAGNILKKVALSGVPPIDLCDVPQGEHTVPHERRPSRGRQLGVRRGHCVRRPRIVDGLRFRRQAG